MLICVFKRYKWSFVNTDDALNILQRDQFVPYLTKINNLLKIKVNSIQKHNISKYFKRKKNHLNLISH